MLMQKKVLSLDLDLLPLELAIGVGLLGVLGVEHVPGLDPGDHGVGELDEVGVDLAELLLDLLRERDVALLLGVAFLVSFTT